MLKADNSYLQSNATVAFYIATVNNKLVAQSLPKSILSI